MALCGLGKGCMSNNCSTIVIIHSSLIINIFVNKLNFCKINAGHCLNYELIKAISKNINV